jgi:death-on-curing protein
LVASEAEAVIKINNLVEGIDEQDSIAAWIAANSQELGLE